LTEGKVGKNLLGGLAVAVTALDRGGTAPVVNDVNGILITSNLSQQSLKTQILVSKELQGGHVAWRGGTIVHDGSFL
jgi:hypothetical protein